MNLYLNLDSPHWDFFYKCINPYPQEKEFDKAIISTLE